VATAVDEQGEGSSDQSFLPVSDEHTESENSYFPEFVRTITRDGKLKSYLHRFGLMDKPMCPCGEEEQTADHLIFQCNELSNQMK
jgi:hypothetical protein